MRNLQINQQTFTHVFVRSHFLKRKKLYYIYSICVHAKHIFYAISHSFVQVLLSATTTKKMSSNMFISNIKLREEKKKKTDQHFYSITFEVK